MKEVQKRKITLITTSILLMVVVIIGVSYAYFSAQTTSTTKTVTTGSLSISFTEGDLINATNIVPINYLEEYNLNEDGVTALCGTEEDGTGKISATKDCWGEPTKYTFTVKNTSSSNVYYDIKLDITEISDELKNYDFKWDLYTTGMIMYSGNFTDANVDENMYLLRNRTLSANASESWTLVIWINDTNKEQNELMNKIFKAKIVVDANMQETNTLASYVINKNIDNVQWTGEDGLDNPTNQVEGMWGTDNPFTKMTINDISYTWYTDDGEGYSYFFRGYNVDNYVEFTDLKYTTDKYTLKDEYQPIDYMDCEIGSYDGVDESECKDVMLNKVKSVGDPLLWRIVRINSDGSVVLVTDDIIGETTYGSSTTYSGSTVETYVNNWYNSNIKNTEYHDMVKLNTFCNDTTVYNSTDYRIKYPTNRCTDNMNRVTAYAGLLTEDEIIFSGVYGSSDGYDSYLSNINNSHILGKNIWTMTAYSQNSIYEYGNDYISIQVSITSTGSVQPVIVLKNTVLYDGGSGKVDDPYTIK